VNYEKDGNHHHHLHDQYIISAAAFHMVLLVKNLPNHQSSLVTGFLLKLDQHY